VSGLDRTIAQANPAPVLFQPIMDIPSGSLRLPNGTLNDVVPSLNQSGSDLGQGVAPSVAAVAFWAVHMGASRRLNGKAGEWQSNPSTPPLVSRRNAHAWPRNEP
jgi:hypothetical protein